MTTPKTFVHLRTFEKLGESQVRLQFAERTDDVGRETRAWLQELRLQRDLEASAKRDAREEQTLSIARRANIIAIIAVIIAVIAIFFDK